MISIFLHRIYMDAMPVEYNSSYIGIEDIYAIFLIAEIIVAVIMSIKAIGIIIEEKREKILVVEERNKTFVKKPIYWILFGAGCCFILILSYLKYAETHAYYARFYGSPPRFWDMVYIPLGLFLINAGMLRFIISHLEKDIYGKDVIVRTLIIFGIIVIVLGGIVSRMVFHKVTIINTSYQNTSSVN